MKIDNHILEHLNWSIPGVSESFWSSIHVYKTKGINKYRVEFIGRNCKTNEFLADAAVVRAKDIDDAYGQALDRAILYAKGLVTELEALKDARQAPRT
jgi:hypothetical protein